MRLQAPIGTWLLYWPGAWSIALAAPAGSLPDPHLLALFGAGSVLLRGAGCTVNDWWDRDVDRLVERTRRRPIASGEISPNAALAFLAAQLSAGLGVLVQLNPFSQILGASSLGLVATYPLMKRITDWPQAYLGLTINWGALLGWAAVHGQCDLSAVLPLYGASVCWTLVYDTIYAHQDKRDDERAGVRSTARFLGSNTPLALSGIGAGGVLLLVGAGAATGAAWPHYAGAAAAGAHGAWQVWRVDYDDPSDCNQKFVSNRDLGALVFLGIAGGRLLA